MRKLLLTFFILILLTPISYAQVVTVSPTQFSHEDLITEVLINSPCALVNNISTVTGTNYGAGNGIGYFENTNPNFPMQNGVVLATGDISDVPGPNNSDTFSGAGWPGDPQLFNYIQSLGIDPGLTGYYDATIMEFDFTPLNDSISFNFVFASNEYGFYQCEYTDAFAFFLEDQVTGAIVNMALVPGTSNVPISVTTIRNNLYNGDCPSQNPNYFGLYYGYPNGLPNATAPINLNGQTVLMQAWQYVTPNNPYRMKLVIADRNDIEWDSAVFIEGGSFFIGNIDLGGDVTLCDNEELVLSVSTANNSVITWFFNGVPIPGESGQTLIVTESGTYGVEIGNPSAPNCVITDEIEVEFKPAAIINLGEDILTCNQTSATLDATPENLSALGGVTYEWFFNGDIVPGEDGPTLEASQMGDYMVVVTTDLDCVTTDEIFMILADYSVDLGPDVTLCDGEAYEIIPTVEGIDSEQVTYLWSTGATTFSIIVTTSGHYSVEVSYEDCTETDDINFAFRNVPVVSLGDNFSKCVEDVVTLTAITSEVTSSSVTYTWFLNGGVIEGASGATINITEAGMYAVEVNDDGCIGNADVVVSYYNNENCIITQGISPNGDGMNDYFDLEFLNDKTGPLEVVIFNRHGKIVFEQNNYINQWRGQTNKGNDLPVGNYFYVIKLLNEEPKTGYIYLNK